MKNFKDSIGNRNRDIPARSAVPQQTVLPRKNIQASRNSSDTSVPFHLNHLLNHTTLRKKRNGYKNVSFVSLYKFSVRYFSALMRI